MRCNEFNCRRHKIYHAVEHIVSRSLSFTQKLLLQPRGSPYAISGNDENAFAAACTLKKQIKIFARNAPIANYVSVLHFLSEIIPSLVRGIALQKFRQFFLFFMRRNIVFRLLQVYYLSTRSERHLPSVLRLAPSSARRLPAGCEPAFFFLLLIHFKFLQTYIKTLLCQSSNISLQLN